MKAQDMVVYCPGMPFLDIHGFIDILIHLVLEIRRY
jgi:hypothetical protein